MHESVGKRPRTVTLNAVKGLAYGAQILHYVQNDIVALSDTLVDSAPCQGATEPRNQEVVMPTQCPSCKAVNRDTATFCDQCGAHLTTVAASDVAPAAVSPPAGTSPVPATQQTAVSPPAVAPSVSSRPETLPEESAPAPARMAAPSIAGRPATLPEDSPRHVAAPPRHVSSTTIRAPDVAPGRPRRAPWYPWLIVISFVFAIMAFQLWARPPWQSHFTESLLIGAVFVAIFVALAAVIGAPFAFLGSTASCKGVVSHMRQWAPLEINAKPGKPTAAQTWLFDLRPTDDQWQPLQDKLGFQLPVLEVEFRTDRVHGSPLEEGSSVVVRGKWHRDRVEAKYIWNLTPGVEAEPLGAPTIFWGRVSGLQPRQAQDVRYPGEKLVEVWSFRLQPTDASFEQLQRDAQGNLLAPWPVEIRAQTISGPLSEGDKVEVRGRVVRGTIYCNDVRNHSAGGAQLIVKDWAGVP